MRRLPLFYVALYALVAFIISYVFPGFLFVLPMIFIQSVFLFGILIIIWGAIQFRRKKTTLNPIKLDNTSKLVTNGIYAYSRNPMYLGFLFVLLSLCFYLENYLSLIILPVFLFHLTQVQIIPEEKMLCQLFGNDYISYTKKVRRWI